MLNHVLVEDNVLSEDECDKIINLFKEKVNKEIFNGINYYHIQVEEYDKINFMVPKILNCYNKYLEKFTELKYLFGKMELKELKFKYFKPGNYFENWHWEHSYRDPYRVLGLTIYLSNNKCGTEFFNADIIETKKGRLTIFPCSFTHTHRGQPCPDNKDRYLFTGYFHSISNNNV